MQHQQQQQQQQVKQQTRLVGEVLLSMSSGSILFLVARSVFLFLCGFAVLRFVFLKLLLFGLETVKRPSPFALVLQPFTLSVSVSSVFRCVYKGLETRGYECAVRVASALLSIVAFQVYLQQQQQKYQKLCFSSFSD